MRERCAVLAMMAGLALSMQLFAQQPQKSAAFEVATIKPVDPGAQVRMVGVMDTPDGIDGENVTLPALIMRAYGYMQFSLEEQVTGVPDWAKSQKYNVKAKMSEADALEFQKLGSDDRQKRIESLLQSLLAERFKLAMHRETKVLPNYELVVAKSGFKLKPTGGDEPDTVKDASGNAITGLVRFHDGAMFFQQNSMDQVAHTLMHLPDVERNVVNRTGLSGSYTFTLHWMSKRGPEADNGPSIFTQLQEDTGLRLQPSKSEVEILVIDHVEPPTEN